MVTGTDTGVGKTFITASLVRAWQAQGLRVGAIKPVASGAVWVEGLWLSPDTAALAHALGGDVPFREITPLLLEAPLAPPAAARLAGTSLPFAAVARATYNCIDAWRVRADVLLIEGVGGFLCPIAEDAVFADLAAMLDCPVLIVARAGLGTINHTLLTVEAVRHRGLRVAGIVLNQSQPDADVSFPSNPRELAMRLQDVGPLISVGYTVDREPIPKELALVTPDALYASAPRFHPPTQ